MHISRIVALIGVMVGAVGLFLKALTSEGESVMEALSESVREVPSGIPTIWGALDTWEQIAVVVAGLVVLLLVFQPPRRSAFGASAATIVTVIGGALTAYAVIEWLDAGDNADRIERRLPAGRRCRADPRSLRCHHRARVHRRHRR